MWACAARVVAAVAALAVVCPLRGASQQAETPRAVVQRTADAVLRVLRSRNVPRDRKRREIEKIVFETVDFQTMARLVLARNGRRFSKEQRAEFVEEFKRHLSRTYGDSIDNYKNESVTILGDRQESHGDRTVQTKIVRNGPADIRVDYRLRRDKQGAWRIIDVIVERVSLVSNFRSQFKEIVAGGGPEKLLRMLREKNAAKEN